MAKGYDGGPGKNQVVVNECANDGPVLSVIIIAGVSSISNRHQWRGAMTSDCNQFVNFNLLSFSVCSSRDGCSSFPVCNVFD